MAIEPILKVKDLTVAFDGTKIIDDLSFDVYRGDVLAIIGPNGAGKTILLKTLLGMYPHRGEIVWKEGVKISYVPQRMEIETDIPLTVREFLSLRGEKFSEEDAKEAVKSVALPETILDAGLGEISVGQRQRILVGWALLEHPDVLLVDEPTADVDIHGQESIYQHLYHLQDKLNLTILLISHDLNIVYKYAEKVLCLNKRQLCFGIPQQVLGPEQMQKLYGDHHALYRHEHHQ